MNSHMMRALADMSKHGGNYFANIHVEGQRQKRLQEAKVEAERIYNRNREDKLADVESNREYVEGRDDTKRKNNAEDRDANYDAALGQKKSLLEVEAAFKKENPNFKQLVKGTNEGGEDVYFKLYSDGRMEETKHQISYAGDPEMAAGKHKDNVRKELNGQLKDIKIQDSKEALDKMVSAYKGENAISDASMIFYFMKTLDPTSVVRESEFRTVAEARGFMTEYEESGKRIPAFLGQFIQRMDSGAGLLPEQREQMLDETISAYNSKAETVANTTSTYETLAKDRAWKRESLGLQRWDMFKPVSRETLFPSTDKQSATANPPDIEADLKELGL